MSAAELQPFTWACEGSECRGKVPRPALRLLVRVNGELICPGCYAANEKRKR